MRSNQVDFCTKEHPRVYGEKRVKIRPKELERGAPPRIRGKENFTIKCEVEKRSTPAYTGKSDSDRVRIR